MTGRIYSGTFAGTVVVPEGDVFHDERSLAEYRPSVPVGVVVLEHRPLQTDRAGRVAVYRTPVAADVAGDGASDDVQSGIVRDAYGAGEFGHGSRDHTVPAAVDDVQRRTAPDDYGLEIHPGLVTVAVHPVSVEVDRQDLPRIHDQGILVQTCDGPLEDQGPGLCRILHRGLQAQPGMDRIVVVPLRDLGPPGIERGVLGDTGVERLQDRIIRIRRPAVECESGLMQIVGPVTLAHAAGDVHYRRVPAFPVSHVVERGDAELGGIPYEVVVAAVVVTAVLQLVDVHPSVGLACVVVLIITGLDHDLVKEHLSQECFLAHGAQFPELGEGIFRLVAYAGVSECVAPYVIRCRQVEILEIAVFVECVIPYLIQIRPDHQGLQGFAFPERVVTDRLHARVDRDAGDFPAPGSAVLVIIDHQTVARLRVRIDEDDVVLHRPCESLPACPFVSGYGFRIGSVRGQIDEHCHRQQQRQDGCCYDEGRRMFRMV